MIVKVCMWTLGILAALASISHGRALFHSFDTGETLKTFEIHPNTHNGISSYVDHTGRTVWRRHVTYEWQPGSWSRLSSPSLSTTARNFGYNKAKAGDPKKAELEAARKLAAARAAKAVADRKAIEARNAKIQAAKIEFAKRLKQIRDKKKRQEVLERAKKRLAAVKAARKAAHEAQKKAAERAKAIKAAREAADKAQKEAAKRAAAAKKAVKKPVAKPVAKALPLKKKPYKINTRAKAGPKTHGKKAVSPLPRTCYCKQGPRGHGKCYYYVKRTSSLRYCSMRRCSVTYSCVGSRKAATMLCIFRKVTNRVVPDGFGTCKDMKVDRHMYVPYSVLTPYSVLK